MQRDLPSVRRSSLPLARRQPAASTLRSIPPVVGASAAAALGRRAAPAAQSVVPALHVVSHLLASCLPLTQAGAPAAGLRALQYTQISAVSQERALRKDPATSITDVPSGGERYFGGGVISSYGDITAGGYDDLASANRKSLT